MFVCGLLDPKGTIYHGLTPSGGSYLGDLNLDLINLKMFYKEKPNKMTELILSESKVLVDIKNGWGKKLYFPHFNQSPGRLYETETELIFIGEITKERISQEGSKSISRMLNEYMNMGYQTIFVVTKALIFGYKVQKKDLDLYMISNDKEYLITISRIKPKLVKRNLSLLIKLTNVVSIRQFKRDNPSVRSYGNRKSLKIEAALWFGLFFLIVGLSLFLTAVEYNEIHSIPVSDVESLSNDGNLVKIEGKIETEGIVIWWRRIGTEPADLDLNYLENFSVSDNTGDINVALSHIKEIGVGRHDDISFQLESCYLEGDTVCIVGKLSEDGNTIYAEYIEQSSKDFGKDIEPFNNVGLSLTIISLPLIMIYLIGYRNYPSGIKDNFTMLAIISIFGIFIFFFIGNEYQIFYYAQLILFVYFIISLIIFAIGKTIIKRNQNSDFGLKTSKRAGGLTHIDTNCSTCGAGFDNYNRETYCVKCSKPICTRCGVNQHLPGQDSNGSYCRACSRSFRL